MKALLVNWWWVVLPIAVLISAFRNRRRESKFKNMCRNMFDVADKKGDAE